MVYCGYGILWVYYGLLLSILGLCWGYIGRMEKNMETIVVFWGNIKIIEILQEGGAGFCTLGTRAVGWWRFRFSSLGGGDGIQGELEKWHITSCADGNTPDLFLKDAENFALQLKI